MTIKETEFLTSDVWTLINFSSPAYVPIMRQLSSIWQQRQQLTN